jgi:alginate O-acetyltransferase complex protein AlgI
VFIVFENSMGAAWLNQIYRPLRHIYTLTIVLTGWIFFRSPDIGFAFGFIGRLFGSTSGYSPAPFSLTTPLPIIEPSFLLAATIGIIFSTQLPTVFKTLKEKLTVRPAAFISFQTAEDVLLLLFFVLAIASQMAGSLKTNIYAAF